MNECISMRLDNVLYDTLDVKLGMFAYQQDEVQQYLLLYIGHQARDILLRSEGR